MEFEKIKAYETVMFHVNNIKKEKQIAALCRSLKLGIRNIKQHDLNKQLGSICTQGGSKGGNVLSKTEGVKAPDKYRLPELIIFYGLSDETLDKFLEEYKKSGIEPVSLKAVVTPENISWSIYKLVCELEKERIQYEKPF